jgi:RNA polymerase primary sigma factor
MSQVVRTRASPSRALAHVRLDRRLKLLACRPGHFAEGALRLGLELDAGGVDIEISDPLAWRGPAISQRVLFENQFSAEIEGILLLDRKEELRLALRIEFARIRLDRSLEGLDLDAEELTERSVLPPTARRRRLEWHALRLEMVERNLYLVLINVERYRHTSAERSDLIQAAAAGLFRAVDGFDWRHGVLFRTYAVHWLNEGFRSFLYNSNSTIRVPVYLQKSMKHVNAAIQRLGNPNVSLGELARETGIPEGRIAIARTAVRKTRSLDLQIEAHGTLQVPGELAVQDGECPYSLALETWSMNSGLEAAFVRLTDRERRVVEMRFGLRGGREHIYAEIAQELGLSLERARQILMAAMSKMRTPRLRKILDSFVA